jgi:hypothetical protein|tara:strand:+ start:677 stop:946 length:270 start_codon:yes stop_codon:yes gene_type:complete
MTTKTSLLANTITPQIRDYIDASMQEAAEAHSRELTSLQQTSEANQNELLKEISIVRANLNTVNGIIANDPSHRLTKAKLIKIATELGL